MQKSTPYLGGLTRSAIALRVFAPKRIFRGISGGRWTAFLGAAASGIKLLELSIRAFRREIPVGRVLLPAILFVELLRISLAGASRAGLIVCATVFEEVSPGCVNLVSYSPLTAECAGPFGINSCACRFC